MHRSHGTWLGIIFLSATLLLAGCSAVRGSETAAGPEGLQPLSLPPMEPADVDQGRLKAVATTSIIGDVVGRVGGEALALTTLMGPGQDPHSYERSAGDLTAAAEAHVIFVHGWNLEEGLAQDLADVVGEAPIVPVAANISPLPARPSEIDGGQDANTANADPHTWLDPNLVLQWVENIAEVLATVDPANGDGYANRAETYRAELRDLIAEAEARVARIPPSRRKLVTNHDSLAYFAAAFNFEVIGTVIPGASTLAEPSAQGLAQLVQKMEKAGVCTVFTETTTSADLADTVAGELRGCDEVQVLSLYTGALGPPGSEAESYMAMMRANVDTIVRGMAP